MCESTWEDLYANAVGGSTATASSSSSCCRDQRNETLNFQNDLSGQKTNDLSSSNFKQQQQPVISGGEAKANDKIPSAYFLIYTKTGDESLYQGKLTLIYLDLKK